MNAGAGSADPDRDAARRFGSPEPHPRGGGQEAAHAVPLAGWPADPAVSSAPPNRDPTGIRAIGVIAADGGILTDSGADCSQENDREFVVRQLVAVKRDNVRLRDELQVRD